MGVHRCVPSRMSRWYEQIRVETTMKTDVRHSKEELGNVVEGRWSPLGRLLRSTTTDGAERPEGPPSQGEHEQR